jgi:diguanylate cyclase (GGDEF) domain
MRSFGVPGVNAMGMHIDLYTLGVIGAAIGIAISVSFTLLGLVLRGLPALRIWASAFWVLTAAALAQGLNEEHSVLSAIVGSGMIALANALMLMGIAVHLRYPLRWRWPLAVVGLLNRHALYEAAPRLIDVCRARGQACCVLMFDLDNFKTINDSWGHAAGDVVLNHFVAVIRETGLPRDTLFSRYGGEEFVLVLPAIDPAQAAELAERMRAEVAAQPATFDTHVIALTTSVGIAGAVDAGFEALVSVADGALYRAKRQGRNRVEWDDDGWANNR